MEVGKRITELREFKGISTNKLANLAGISQSYLREIELGKKNPTVEILSYICDSLNISLSNFFSSAAIQANPSLVSALELLTAAEQEKLAELIYLLKK